MTAATEAAHRPCRMETRAVPVQPPAGDPEDGLTQYARELARVLCAALDGHTWRTETQAPYLPHPQAAYRHAVAVAVDRRWLVTVTATTSAGTARDLWVTTVNGRPVPPRPLPRELPNSAQAIARAVRRHLAGTPADPCDSIGCHNTPTAATYGRSLCVFTGPLTTASEDPVTTRRRLTLLPPHPPITTVETTDTRTDRVRYRFGGPRATGTIVIAPYHRGWEPLPSEIHLQFGEAPDHQRESRRTDRPRINGVSLIGGLIGEVEEFLTRGDPTRWLYFRRTTGPYTTARAPERTSQYAAAIVHALLTTWCARPDRADLIRAAARHTAARRLHELYRAVINPTRARIDTLTRELDQHQQTAADLCALAGEHHHIHGDQPATGQPGTDW